MTSAKISATASKHKVIESELMAGFTRCSNINGSWTVQGAPGYYPSYQCSYVMSDLNRWVNQIQYHFQWQHPINPYEPNEHKSESVSRSGCRADGTPVDGGKDQLGKTCLTLKGNIVGVTSNIGDEYVNSEYLVSTIFVEEN